MKFKLFQDKDDELVEKELAKYEVQQPQQESQPELQNEVNEEAPTQEYQIIHEEDIVDDSQEEDEEYEYVTPQYLRNAIVLGLVCFVFGAAAIFLLLQEGIQTTIRDKYIAQGYVLTDTATATASDIAEGKTAYSKGVLITGTYTPLDTSNATATAADILIGKTAYVNGQLVIGTLPYYNGNTVFDPTTKDIIISKGCYINKLITVNGDGNLQPINIRKGIEIFGIVGTYNGD